MVKQQRLSGNLGSVFFQFFFSIVLFAALSVHGIAGDSGTNRPRTVEAVNSLSVLDPTVYGSRPGYIDEATLVVEPHGAYAEQSLYIKYSDHHQFSSPAQIEIVHRFELPHGATVNDLWLWIGDSVMQAIVLDTWSARHIYDSIVSKHRDPAFLSKNGDQYELHIYPLVPGSFRKIKMNFIVPIQWAGTAGTIELPSRFLFANNAATKPLEILFRQREPVWGIPVIQENTSIHFSPLRDTLGYHFFDTHINNISALTTMNLGVTTEFGLGMFFGSNEKQNQPTCFQLGIIPEQVFDLHADTSGKNTLVGLDFSGSSRVGISATMANIGSLLHTALSPRDSVQFVVTGAGTSAVLNLNPVAATLPAVDTVIARFIRSPLAKSIDSSAPPKLLYCDSHASTCWTFQGVDALAKVTNTTSLWFGRNLITSADIVAGYNYGFEDVGETSSNLAAITDRLDSLFLSGGRFLGYFDYNRAKAPDPLSPHYIPGLTTTRRTDDPTTLYRNVDGNIGRYLPEQIMHYGFDILSYTPDSSVKVELADAQGGPVIISKRIGRGLIVITSIWSFRDDDAIKKILAVPMLGLNSVSRGAQMLPGLLETLREMSLATNVKQVFVFSNGDSLTPVVSSQSWKSSYIAGFVGHLPVFNTINLLDGRQITPPYLTDNLVQYFGSGYLLKSIASATLGSHFETHITDWPQIRSRLAYNVNLPLARLTLDVTVDDGAGAVTDTREVNPDNLNPNNARFFIGSTNAQTSIGCTLKGWVAGVPDSQVVTKRFLLSHDSTKNESVLPVMLANEQVNDIFKKMAQVAHPDTADTLAIVHIAVKNRLLCDFTAMLALEPHDTIQFMHHPFDESRLVNGIADEMFDDADSITVGAYPNPFNSTTTISVKTKQMADLSLDVYNILGQKMSEFVETNASPGLHTFHWNGTNLAGQPASSGIYFARFAVRNIATGKLDYRIKKVLLVQ